MASLAHASFGYPAFSAAEKLVEIMPIILFFSAQVVKLKMFDSFSSSQSQHQPEILYKALTHVAFRW